MGENSWSNEEKMVAREAFEKAYQRETLTLLETIREKVSGIETIDNAWHLHDFLSAKRHELDGKYDYRDSFLIIVIARLVKEGWLHLDELDGLEEGKLIKISALTRM